MEALREFNQSQEPEVIVFGFGRTLNSSGLMELDIFNSWIFLPKLFERKMRFSMLPKKRMLFQNYQLAKAYHHLRIRMSDSGQKGDRILVYQMGKVGSSSIVASLRTLHLGTKIYHIHTLVDEEIRKAEDIYKKSWRKGSTALHIWQSQYLRKQLDKDLLKNQWKIITLVRDPIAQNISKFFQGLLTQGVYDYRKKMQTMTQEAIVEELIALYQHRKLVGKDSLVWFDEEIKGVFGIDIFAKEFPKMEGYDIYNKDNVSVLLIKLEYLNQCASIAFNKFLNVANFKLSKSNVSENKEYSELYRKFTDAITLPESYVDEVYQSPYLHHFYEESEIEVWKRKWCGRR